MHSDRTEPGTEVRRQGRGPATRRPGLGALAALALVGLTACSPVLHQLALGDDETAGAPWAIVGDSTLYLADQADPIPGSRGWPGASPYDAIEGIAGDDRVLWVYVGSNLGNGRPGVDDDIRAMTDACQTRECMVTVEGVVGDYDRAVRAHFRRLCDLSLLDIARPDGTHPDTAGAKVMSRAIKGCL
jgi:hypothetical protein